MSGDYQMMEKAMRCHCGTELVLSTATGQLWCNGCEKVMGDQAQYLGVARMIKKCPKCQKELQFSMSVGRYWCNECKMYPHLTAQYFVPEERARDIAKDMIGTFDPGEVLLMKDEEPVPTVRAFPTAGLRFVIRHGMRRLQQRWQIDHIRSGNTIKTEEVWRDVPEVTNE